MKHNCPLRKQNSNETVVTHIISPSVAVKTSLDHGSILQQKREGDISECAQYELVEEPNVSIEHYDIEEITTTACYMTVKTDDVQANEMPTSASEMGVELTKKDWIPPGLVNPGTNTCYLNSVLQSLFHNEIFVKWILNFESSHGKTCTYNCKLTILVKCMC